MYTFRCQDDVSLHTNIFSTRRHIHDIAFVVFASGLPGGAIPRDESNVCLTDISRKERTSRSKNVWGNISISGAFDSYVPLSSCHFFAHNHFRYTNAYTRYTTCLDVFTSRFPRRRYPTERDGSLNNGYLKERTGVLKQKPIGGDYRSRDLRPIRSVAKMARVCTPAFSVHERTHAL